MLIHEFQIAELYVVLDCKNDRSRGTQSIEVLKNEPYDNTQGQLGDMSPLSKLAEVPPYLAVLFPKGSLTIVEAWNAFPTCFTYITSTYFLKHKFFIACESAYLPGNCTEENALHLSQEDLERRSVQVIRIENNLPKQPSTPSDVHPSTYKCPKTGRGLLSKGWESRKTPIITCNKLLRVQFDYVGFQGTMENAIREQHLKVFHNRLAAPFAS
ncbi:hypothetical protein AC1031_004689 [Aphanomyces cochlioides]|nr:hypothetical protein AC1031_004689 [Aphanomyces cochlioides]